MSKPKEKNNKSSQLDADLTELMELCSPENEIKISPDSVVNEPTTHVPSSDLFSKIGNSPKCSPPLDLDINGIIENPLSQNKVKISLENSVNKTSTHIPSPKVYFSYGDSPKCSPPVDLEFNGILEIPPSQNTNKISSENTVDGTTTHITSSKQFSLNGDSSKGSLPMDLDIDGILQIPPSQNKIKNSLENTVNGTTTNMPSPKHFSSNKELPKCTKVDLDIDSIVEIPPRQNKIKISAESTVNRTTTHVPAVPLPELFSIKEYSPKCSPQVDLDLDGNLEIQPSQKKINISSENTVNETTAHILSPKYFLLNGDTPKHSQSLEEDFTLSPLEKNIKVTPEDTVNGFSTYVSSPDLFSINGDSPKRCSSLDGDFTKLEEYTTPEKKMKMTPDVASPKHFSVNGETLKCSQQLDVVDLTELASSVKGDVVNGPSTHISSSNLCLENENTIKMKTALIEDDINMSDYIVFGNKDNSAIVTNTINVDELETDDSDDEDNNTVQYWINKKMAFPELFGGQYDKIKNLIETDGDFENLSQPTEDKKPRENTENNHTDSDIDEYSQERISQIVFDKIVSKSLLVNGEIQLDDTQIDETKVKNISEYTSDELTDDEEKSEIIQNGTDSFQVNGEGNYFQINGDIEETKVRHFKEYTLDDLDDIEVKAEIIQNRLKSLQMYEDRTRKAFDSTQIIKLNGNLSEDDGEEIEVIVIDPDKSASEESQSQICGVEKDAVFDQINAYNETADLISEEDKSSQNMNMTLKYEDGILPLLTEVDQSVLHEADILMFEEYFAQLNAGEIQTVIDDPQVTDSYENHFLEHENEKVDEGKTIMSEDIISQESQEEKQTSFDEVKTVDNIIDGIKLEENITYLNEADVLTLEEYMLQASAEEAQMFLDKTQMIMCQEVTLPSNEEEEEQIVVDNSHISEFRDINLHKIRKVPKRKAKTKKTKPRIRITPLRKVVKSFMRKKTRKQRPDPDYSTWYMDNDNPHKKLEESKRGRRRKQKNPRFINDLPAVLRRLNLNPVPRPPKLSPKKPLETFTQVVKPVHPYKIRRKPRKPKIKKDRPEQTVEEEEHSGIYSRKSLLHNSKEIVIVDENFIDAHNQSIISISSTDEESRHIELVEDISPSVSHAEEDSKLMKVVDDNLPPPGTEEEDEKHLEKDLSTDKDEKPLEENLITDEDEKPLEKEFITDEEFIEYAVSVIDYLYEQKFVNEE